MYWDLPSLPGIVLRESYEKFCLSVGLYRRIFELDYNSLDNLAEHCLFTHLERLCHMFSLSIKVNTKYKVSLMRERD